MKISVPTQYHILTVCDFLLRKKVPVYFQYHFIRHVKDFFEFFHKKLMTWQCVNEIFTIMRYESSIQAPI